MSDIVSISTITADKLSLVPEIMEAASRWLQGRPKELELFERFHRASKTESRSYVLPLNKILELDGQSERAANFINYGLPLGLKAIEATLKRANLKATDIGTVIFTSCTCPLIPSLDTSIIQQLGFRPDVKRIPIYQQGCAGGVVGLGIADRLAHSGENVLLVSVELCSLLFRLQESSSVHILGSALFADGAAASVISPSGGGVRFIGWQSFLIPETSHLMGYTIKDNGAHLLLDKELPAILAVALPSIVKKFLETLKLSASDFSCWVIHPGGVKILDGIAKILGLEFPQYKWSYDVLSKIGNMSSATIQFVLADCLESGELGSGDRIMMLGIGPGLTVELIAFEYS